MRVAVTGGRDFSNRELICAVLTEIHTKTPITAMAVGDAEGVDSIANTWMELNKIPERSQYFANWKDYGKLAGPMRNQILLEDFKPDILVAFPGGKGTADMIRRANKSGVKIHHVRIED